MNCITLPKWLDDYIFENLGAKYSRSNADMTVIDWDRTDVLNYLGTYFPRSYAETYCILHNYFGQNKNIFSDKEEINIFDFGCGTGGEIIGAITILNKTFPNIKRFNVTAFDGNQYALRFYEQISGEFSYQNDNFSINNSIIPVCINDFYDLSIIDETITDAFDIEICSKSVCEFVTKDRFEQNNAYKHITEFLLTKLKDEGTILLTDVSTYNNTSREWLPHMMDNGLEGYNIVDGNNGYNEKFYVTHSRCLKDISKITWRILKK